MKTTCIILAGGFGTRLRQVVSDRPKCLAPVGERSFLEIQLELLTSQGISDFVLALGYQADQVQAEVERLAGRFSIACVLEPRPLGTGGAIAFAMAAMEVQEALVANGDTFLSGDLAAMLKPLERTKGEMVRMAIVHVEDCSRFGGVVVDNLHVCSIAEKARDGAGAVNAGIYRVSSDVFFDARSEEAFSFESRVLPRLTAAGNVRAALILGEFTDIGVPSDYYRFCNEHG